MLTQRERASIVTGAASGIGQAVAINLSKQGVHVVLVDLNSCEKTIELLGEASYLECLGDIRDEEFVKATEKNYDVARNSRY